MRKTLPLCLALAFAIGPAAADEWNTPESRARWAELSQAMFGPKAHLETNDHLVRIVAPPVAQDAALVPVTIEADAKVAALDLVIDQNPSPVAAKIRFGGAGDPRQMALRVRVDGFTNMHAVAAMADGKLTQAVAFVQGAGGCSAPVGGSTAEAAAHMGEMRMKFSTNAALGNAPQATLMIRHPNFNGMQTDPKTHAFTPPRYIKSIAVKRGEETVFTMASDISLSTNPVITFLYKPAGSKPFDVTVADSGGGTWSRRFDPAQATN